MNKYQVIAITHKSAGLEEVGRYHLADTDFSSRLNELKTGIGATELFYLSTCNRVEFHLVFAQPKPDQRQSFFAAFHPSWDNEDVSRACETSVWMQGEDAVEHLFCVASSIDSLVIGEREIITQVRTAYEKCQEAGLTGDFLRLVIKATIETAKDVYTNTEIARKPVSVVSLAYHHLKDLNVPLNARFLIIGAGKTNRSMLQFLNKHGYKDFAVFNRSLPNAEKLAAEINGKPFALSALASYKGGFDVLITCTGSSEHIVTPEIYHALLQGDGSPKIVIDLAIPNDFDTEILRSNPVTLISVENLKTVAEANLAQRGNELERCRLIIRNHVDEFRKIQKERSVELAMRDVPKKVKEIRDTAVNEVFAKELESLDPASREVLEKVLTYVEKKYITVPMKMAKSIILEQTTG